MTTQPSAEPRFIDAISEPAAVFDTPRDVVSMAHWSVAKRRAVLERWKFYLEYAGVGEPASAAVAAGNPVTADGTATMNAAALANVQSAMAQLDEEQRQAAADAADSPSSEDALSVEAHKVAGVFGARDEARDLVRRLHAIGIEDGSVHLVGPHDAERLDAPRSAIAADAGRAVASGAVLGVAGAATVAAVLATPIASALMASALGGVLGGGAGAAAAMALSEQDFRELAQEALESGYWLVVVETDSVGQALDVQDVIASSAALRSIDQSGAVRNEASVAP